MTALAPIAGELRLDRMQYPIARAHTVPGVSTPVDSPLSAGRKTAAFAVETYELTVGPLDYYQVELLKADHQVARFGALPMAWTDDQGTNRDVWITSPTLAIAFNRGRAQVRIRCEVTV